MAEVERPFAVSRDAANGAFSLICIIKDTNFTTAPDGRWSPMVVGVKDSVPA